MGTAKRVHVEINLNNLKHNISEIRRTIDKKVMIMGVVKADAYGHGSVEVSRTLVSSGVERLAVATIDEGVELRKSGIHVPILILGSVTDKDVYKIFDYELTPIVPSINQAQIISSAAVKRGRNIKVHIKIDSGMGRLGFFPDNSGQKQIIDVARLPRLEFEGIMTHFSCADACADGENQSYTFHQFKLFMELCESLKKQGVEFEILHSANSAATLRYKEMHLNMIRPGLIIYGLYPENTKKYTDINLKPVMSFKSKLVHIKIFPKDYFISYGRSFKTSRDSNVIGVVSAGYADGYWRALSNKGHVLINGKAVPVVGKVCMDYFMVDLTDIYNSVHEGQEVVLIGKSGDKEITANMIGDLCGTINYEVICRVSKRVERVYVNY